MAALTSKMKKAMMKASPSTYTNLIGTTLGTPSREAVAQAEPPPFSQGRPSSRSLSLPW
jgi:hypothetical protein